VAITLDVPGQFSKPKLTARLGQNGISTPAMTVPETPVNEHSGLKPRQDDVRLTRQFFTAKREAEPAPM
jgi:hypothetical protein